ncbi:MAG: tetratricopeptide repeat protein [Cyclobacteriaceae bacterium]
MNKILIIIFLLLFTSSCLTSSDKKNRDKFELALALFDQEKYNETILHLDTLLSLYPTNEAVWCLKGRSLFANGYEMEGIEALNKAIAINDSYYSAYKFRALMKSLQEDSNYEETISDFEVALKEYPTDTILALNKARFTIKKRDFKEAKKALDYVLELDSANYSAQVMLASVIGKLGNNISALNRLNEIIYKQDSFEPSAFEERAFVYMELEKFDSAISDYNMVLDHSNLFIEYPVLRAYAINNLGYAQYKAGNASEGLDNINKAINLEPSNSYAYMDLQQKTGHIVKRILNN